MPTATATSTRMLGLALSTALATTMLAGCAGKAAPTAAVSADAARVALAKGLPADLVDRLRGDTESDIAADADALLALVNAPRTPLPDPTQGTQGAAPTTPEQEFLAFTANLP